MQGVILSAGTAQGTILGDDGARYIFTPLGWRNDAISPGAGMRVDCEARGSHSVGIYPILGAAPTPHAQPPLVTPTPSATPPLATGGRPSRPAQALTSPPTPGSVPVARRSASTQVATGGFRPRPPTAVAGRERGGLKWLWALMAEIQAGRLLSRSHLRLTNRVGSSAAALSESGVRTNSVRLARVRRYGQKVQVTAE